MGDQLSLKCINPLNPLEFSAAGMITITASSPEGGFFTTPLLYLTDEHCLPELYIREKQERDTKEEAQKCS